MTGKIIFSVLLFVASAAAFKLNLKNRLPLPHLHHHAHKHNKTENVHHKTHANNQTNIATNSNTTEKVIELNSTSSSHSNESTPFDNITANSNKTSTVADLPVRVQRASGGQKENPVKQSGIPKIKNGNDNGKTSSPRNGASSGAPKSSKGNNK